MAAELNEFDALVPAEKMPPCPICGLPITVEPRTYENRIMVFHAHGLIALAHDSCHPNATREAE